MNTTKLVLFDLDGLLIQSWPFIVASYRHVLSHLGLSDEGLHHPIMRHCTLHQAYAHLGIVTQEQIKTANRLHRQFQTENIRLLKPFPDALPTLIDLCEDFALGVVSNRTGNTSELLKHCGLLDLVELVIDKDVVPSGKPSPLGISYALEHFQVHPEEAVIVGDTIVDVLAGKAMGTWTVAVDGSECKDDLIRARPDYLLNNLGEIVPLLR